MTKVEGLLTEAEQALREAESRLRTLESQDLANPENKERIKNLRHRYDRLVGKATSETVVKLREAS